MSTILLIVWMGVPAVSWSSICQFWLFWLICFHSFHVCTLFSSSSPYPYSASHISLLSPRSWPSRSVTPSIHLSVLISLDPHNLFWFWYFHLFPPRMWISHRIWFYIFWSCWRWIYFSIWYPVYNSIFALLSWLVFAFL